MAVLDSARFRAHDSFVRDVAQVLDAEMALTCASNCLLRTLPKAQGAADALGSPRLQEILLRMAVALRRGKPVEAVAAGLAELEDGCSGGTDKEILRAFLSAVSDFEARRASGDARAALWFASRLPLNVLDLLEDAGVHDSATIGRLADLEVTRQLSDLELGLDGFVGIRGDDEI